jgi:hypothetical protein
MDPRLPSHYADNCLKERCPHYPGVSRHSPSCPSTFINDTSCYLKRVPVVSPKYIVTLIKGVSQALAGCLEL